MPRVMIMLDLVLPASYAEAHDRAWQEYQVAAAQHAKQQAQLREKMSEAADSGPAPTMSSAMTLASFYTGPALPTDPVPTFLARGTDRAMLLPSFTVSFTSWPYLPPSPPSADPATRLVNTARRKLEGSDRETLAQLLDGGRMLYRIRPDGKGLECRVSIPSTAHAQLSADAAIRAGRHTASERLIKAWDALYSVESDPGVSYGHAVRAVEAAVNPIFLPAATNPSLGTVRDHLQQARSKYELVIADIVNSPGSIDVIVELVGTLWFGHRDRHEGGLTSAAISPASAEAALSIATTLVHLFSIGAVRRKPS